MTSLNLEDNHIGDSGAQALAQALTNNTSLTSLNLTRNYIGDSGAKALATALTDNTSLIYLSLGSNNIRVLDIQALISYSLQKNEERIKARLTEVTQYLDKHFVFELSDMSNLPPVLTNIVKDCLTPDDLISQTRDSTSSSSSSSGSSSVATSLIPSLHSKTVNSPVFTSKPDSKEKNQKNTNDIEKTNSSSTLFETIIKFLRG